MKDSEKDKFEQFFQNSLKGYEEDPSDDFWSEMEGKIPSPPTISFWKKYWKFGSFLLVSGVVALASWQWWNYGNDINLIQETLELQNEKIGNVENQMSEIKNESSIFSLNKESCLVACNLLSSKAILCASFLIESIFSGSISPVKTGFKALV